MTLNTKLRIVFVVWLVAFPLISCGPAVLGDGALGTVLGGLFGLTLGAILLVPWLIGLGLLFLAVRFTDERRPPR